MTTEFYLLKTTGNFFSENINSKDGQKLFYSKNKLTANALKTVSERATQR